VSYGPVRLIGWCVLWARKYGIFFSLHPPVTYWFAMSHTTILAFYTYVILFHAEITLKDER